MNIYELYDEHFLEKLFWISVIERGTLNLSVDRKYSIVALSMQTFLTPLSLLLPTNKV